MKRSALQRRTRLAPRCICGHSKSKHSEGERWQDTGCLARCLCGRYSPKRSLAPRKKNPAKRRYAARRDDEYRAWIGQRRCAMRVVSGHECAPPVVVEVAHLSTRGAGGGDRDNVLPLCRGAHRVQHLIGIESFAKLWGFTSVDGLTALAKAYTVRYDKERGNE